MSRKVLSKLRKLRGRSAAELRVRGAQAWHVQTERLLPARTQLVNEQKFFRLLAPAHSKLTNETAADLLAHFRTRARPHFFAAFAAPEATRAELRRRFGGQTATALRARADAIKAGKFDLLGRRALDFGTPIDWHLEPTSGVRAPLVHWSKIDFLDPRVAGDKKFTWELNRQQHFITLGRAYWQTNDETYAETFVAHIESWMDANPPKLGINWASSLEVSFRAIAWLWALHFFKDSPALTPSVFLRLLKFLYAHARHIETYLSTYFSPNTHLTGEALGLFYLGTLLPEFKRAARWRKLGARILLAQLERHIKPDGVYFEHTTYYHRYTADFYTHFLLLAQVNDDPLLAAARRKLEAKLTALCEHLLYITRPDGTTPYIGDDDAGRLAPLDERAPDDFRATLAVAAALFARGDYKFVAGDASEDVLWLLSAQGLRAYDALAAHAPAHDSRAFAASGYYVMRDGWTRDANYMLVDGGPHGAHEINCGHAHADALAFDMAARGRTLLVDPGTYTYTGAGPWRDHFRRTQAHNTLTIDDESASVPASPFRWQHTTDARTHRWLTTARFDFFAATHDGYQRLTAPATHERSILLLKRDYWIVRDRVETDGAHKYDLAFHFAADAAPSIDENDVCVREVHEALSGLELHVCARTGGAWHAREDWVAPAYGARVAAPLYKFSVAAAGAQEFITACVPLSIGQKSARTLHELEAVGGRAFMLQAYATQDVNKHNGNARGQFDLLLLKAGDAIGDDSIEQRPQNDLLNDVIEAARFSSDFAWTWARFGADEDVPEELVLLDGRCLRFDGYELVRARERAGYVWARRVHNDWLIETDTGGAVNVRTFEAASYVRH